MSQKIFSFELWVLFEQKITPDGENPNIFNALANLYQTRRALEALKNVDKQQTPMLLTYMNMHVQLFFYAYASLCPSICT